MEILKNIFRKERENKIDIILSPEAANYLKSLMSRPNPNLAEFAFLGLGQGNFIDQILAIDEDLSNKTGLFREEGFSLSRVPTNELAFLSIKLQDAKRVDDVLVIGHFHPFGQKNIDGVTYSINPSEALLEPSMGSRAEGGPTARHDVGFYKWLRTNDPMVEIPYAGIAAMTQNGPKLKIYDIEQLIKIKRYRDVDKVPQTTINL